MAETPSTMPPLGMKAPSFRLSDVVSGRAVSLDDFKSAPALLVMFICNHCPYVKHVREHLAQLVSEYQARGVAAVGISSNDEAQFPDDSPEKMKQEARMAGYTFPYCLTKHRQWQRNTAPLVLRISFCSIRTAGWFTAAKWTTAVPRAAVPSPARTCAPR